MPGLLPPPPPPNAAHLVPTTIHSTRFSAKARMIALPFGLSPNRVAQAARGAQQEQRRRPQPRETESSKRRQKGGSHAERQQRTHVRKSRRESLIRIVSVSQLLLDFESSPSGLPVEYLDIPPGSDMRHFNHDSGSTLESQPPPPSVLFPTSVPLLNTPAGFAPDLCHSVPGYLASLDVRPPRLSSSTSLTGMAAAPRSHHPLPNIGYNTRGIYSTGTPGFPKRSQDSIHRSPPPYSAVSARRHPLSPTPSPGIAFNSIRMDPPYGTKGHSHIPPLLGLTQHGQLMYANNHSPIKIDIHGTIDKGFFLSEGEWTCYRRNYFSCVCSYSLSPLYPNAAMQWTPNTSPTTTYDVYGFSMCIAAVVSESDSHTIELVQHTPKRDKGPISQPDKVQMAPKPHHQSSHPLAGIYQDGHSHRLVGGGSGGALYEGFSQPQGAHPTEYTFERIQFKQATANNGKRRAAQQYYHLVVELYGHVGEAGRGAPDQWVKIAQRKSAKMIVRGRSPGHYQSERRGSTSSGPGNSGGTLSNYPATVSDYGPGTSILGSNSYGTANYDHHQHQRAQYGSNRQHELPMEPVMAVDDVKAMDNTKDYQYYPTPIYDVNPDQRHQSIEMFTHRSDPEAIVGTGADGVELSASRLKHEQESTLPSLFYSPSNSFVSRGGCNRYDGKSTSAGYYPTMLPQSS